VTFAEDAVQLSALQHGNSMRVETTSANFRARKAGAIDKQYPGTVTGKVVSGCTSGYTSPNQDDVPRVAGGPTKIDRRRKAALLYRGNWHTENLPTVRAPAALMIGTRR
jgi:hypothetical protein